MSRRGPGYIETEEEMFADLDRKRAKGDVTDATVREYIDLYEFAKEIGDRADISGVKNARVKLIVKSHQGTSSGNPGAFTANVNGYLKVWPARMPIDYGYLEAVPWEEEDYLTYERAFRSLCGLPNDVNQIQFDEFVAKDVTGEFKTLVTDFVTACRAQEQ